MTDNEFISLLENAESEIVAFNDEDVFTVGDVLDLIYRQKEMIDALIAGQETLQKCIAEKTAEIERLQKETELFKYLNEAVHHIKIDGTDEVIDFKTYGGKVEEINQLCDRLCNIQTARVEAVKEFWEKAKRTREYRTCPYVYVMDGDNLVKEMECDK